MVFERVSSIEDINILDDKELIEGVKEIGELFMRGKYIPSDLITKFGRACIELDQRKYKIKFENNQIFVSRRK